MLYIKIETVGRERILSQRDVEFEFQIIQNLFNVSVAHFRRNSLVARRERYAERHTLFAFAYLSADIYIEKFNVRHIFTCIVNFLFNRTASYVGIGNESKVAGNFGEF